MKLYAGTTEQFRTDARRHRIAEKLRAEYTTQIGHRPAPSEVASWQNSLMALSMLIDQAELDDHGIILEYQLGNTSRRLDAMLTGHASTSAENAVVVELKSTADNCVELRIGPNRVRRVLQDRSRSVATNNGCSTTTRSSTRPMPSPPPPSASSTMSPMASSGPIATRRPSLTTGGLRRARCQRVWVRFRHDR
ncbi:MAG TPA: hypothetical protein VNL74_00035 [Methylococcus sp.]|nr:hypothetical protein [Methylococcus sp.]